MALYNIVRSNIVDQVWTQTLKITNTYDPDEPIGTSLLGFPIYSNLQIKNGQWQDPVTGQIKKYSGLRIDTAIMQVSSDKNMVQTPIQGRNGTIKELISTNDYQVQIQGVLLGPGINNAPLEEMNVLIKLIQAQAAIEVISEYLNAWGIYNLVIQTGSMQEVPGSRSQVPFTLSCMSDIPYDIELSIEQEQE